MIDTFNKFYQRAIEYLESRFDFESTQFKEISIFQLGNDRIFNFDRLIQAVKTLGIDTNEDELFTEYCRFKANFTVISNLSSPIEKWKSFLISNPDYTNIKQIIETIFSIPSSNASVERVFSLMGNLWTDERNRLITDTVKAEIQLS